MSVLVLAGGGHSHALLLRRWAMRPEKRPDGLIILVSQSSTTLYSGMIPGLIAGRYSLDDIFGIADPHEVAHPVPRKPRSGEPYHRMELFGSLPDGKSANSESIEGKWRHPVDAFGP